MIIGIATDERYQPGIDLIAENHNLKQHIAELEQQLERLGRLNLLLNAEVEAARRAEEARQMAEQAARDEELREIIERHTAMLHREREREETARKIKYGTRHRAGTGREWAW